MKKIFLDENEIPTKWYNIQADLPTPLDPPLNPKTHEPIGPNDLSAIFPMGLIQQEVSQERYIPIPEEVREIYRMWRPTPLIRAERLERALKTPAKIYYKWEGVSPPEVINQIQRLHRSIIIKKKGLNALQRKPVLDNGGRHWHLAQNSLISNAGSTW